MSVSFYVLQFSMLQYFDVALWNIAHLNTTVALIISCHWLTLIDSNAKFFILNFYLLFLENAIFYVALIKDTFLFYPPKWFSYQLVRSVISQSLSLAHMGNGVHFFLLTDIAYLSEYEFQSFGWFLKEGAETCFQASFQPYIEPIFFQITQYHIYHLIDN